MPGLKGVAQSLCVPAPVAAVAVVAGDAVVDAGNLAFGC